MAVTVAVNGAVTDRSLRTPSPNRFEQRVEFGYDRSSHSTEHRGAGSAR